jgi:hypothetical protein
MGSWKWSDRWGLYFYFFIFVVGVRVRILDSNEERKNRCQFVSSLSMKGGKRNDGEFGVRGDRWINS